MSRNNTENLGINSERTNRINRVARGLARVSLGIFMLSFSGDSSLNLKPEGPYSIGASAFTGDLSMHQAEVLHADSSQESLVLADNLDGILETQGFLIYVNREAITEKLDQDMVAVITQKDHVSYDYSDGEEVVVQKVTLAPPGGLYTEDGIHNIQDSAIRKSLSEFTRSDSSDNSIGNPAYIDGGPSAKEWLPIGNGLTYHTDGPSDISITFYEISDDGKPHLVEELSTTVDFASNVDCNNEAIENPITSEIKLSDEQIDKVCSVIDAYNLILPDEYRIKLDVASSMNGRKDSVNNKVESILLTYPYVEGKELSLEEFQKVALHEIMHILYSITVDKDQQLGEELDKSYKYIVDAMQYRMPTEEAERFASQQVGDVEPVWGILTESSYDKTGPKYGHPWDNTTEMLSSTTAVLAFYPGEFIDKFRELQPEEQEAVRDLVIMVGETFERNKIKTEDIIPEYDMVLSEVTEISK